MENIYADIATRTGGNIYIGVVGPVRTGKSTLIKRIMEQLVIPNIDEPYRRERAKDELPQSGSGRVIMTSEPKFVPEEAVEISPDKKSRLRVRMIDTVGYMVEGAMGAEEDGVPRMVATPWYDYEIPMVEAAELGTQKVMQEHCSIGLVVTTDGTITDIPREAYREAEARAIIDMQATGKPFLVVINSQAPQDSPALDLQKHLKAQFGIDAVIADCQTLTNSEIQAMLEKLLYAFPMTALHIRYPRWLDALEPEHPVKATLYQALSEQAQDISSLSQAACSLEKLNELEHITHATISGVDLATGIVVCELGFPEKLFYEILSAKAGMEIKNDGQLLTLLTELAQVKKEYDKVADALSSVKATGYGIVMPCTEDMNLEKPELSHKNGAYGVKLRAGAPSIHMIRVDIDTEITPMVGGEKQSQDLLSYLGSETPEKLWECNIFGKSVYSMVQEGITAKLVRTPEDVQSKFRGCLSKIVNEGANGLICLII
ncbi:MAG: stage IV sporulation protein A [Oscillospiraceae bacterium]|nr:stage IV sporulation protein A [Oscillospiraceae bacterium]